MQQERKNAIHEHNRRRRNVVLAVFVTLTMKVEPRDELQEWPTTGPECYKLPSKNKSTFLFDSQLTKFASK